MRVNLTQKIYLLTVEKGMNEGAEIVCAYEDKNSAIAEMERLQSDPKNSNEWGGFYYEILTTNLTLYSGQ